MTKTIILDGKLLASKILSEIEIEVRTLKAQFNLIPKLAIISVGNNSASSLYISNKRLAAAKVRIDTDLINLPSTVSEQQLLEEINHLNHDPNISGIIVQLPLPISIDKNKVLQAINPLKDIDGFHPLNAGYNFINQNHGFIPPTALGCYELIKNTHTSLRKHIAIVGRSNIVGKPLAALLLNHDATITICHSKTPNLKQITQNCDIVVCAIGKPKFFTADYFKDGVIIIDVGINWLAENDKLVGDVDQEAVQDIASFISPVPGGAGPLTVAFLLKNTIKAMRIQHGHTIDLFPN